ncbi:LysR family transcriptional regulator [Bordetella genomosp. 9]|uniref:LysR family transcriptional regulator n=1 Tax=Bordetella genomosp. 9 TaxID=1416803 RepID=A0A1W6Z0B5_9BORD|nr:LysR family transcriptional regulator [Bordetella genomosp. 9]ARP86569.1 LysR family transcriptional regulator [Bordetella genomosp. 9]ARP90565.1 LysR family transcriptional regulator [Bordetella genomosp. 9]
MNLSARHLRAFVALAEEKHFTRAAQRCHLTQPAFSALIRAIEDAAGMRLFDRTTRHVELTAEGRILEASARRLLADFDLVMEDLRDHAARRRGRVAVAALPSLAAGWLPPILADFHRAYPGIALTLRDALLDACLDMVRNGEVDFAVAARRADMSDLDSEFLHADRFHLVCRDDHPLAAQPAVTLAQVVKWPLIQLAPNSSVRQHLDAALARRKLRPLVEVEHLATVTGLVAAGMGVSIVPAMTLFHFRRPGLAIRPLAGKAPTRSLYLVKRAGRTLPLAAQTLYGALLAQREHIAAIEAAPGVSRRSMDD